MCRDRGIEVDKFDIAHDVKKVSDKYDVAISMEVAEHLPEKCADGFVGLLSVLPQDEAHRVLLSNAVVFTVAHPGQGGDSHSNEQPASYWVAKFVNRCFRHNQVLTEKWKSEWSASGEFESWYYQNLMIFTKTD